MKFHTVSRVALLVFIMSASLSVLAQSGGTLGGSPTTGSPGMVPGSGSSTSASPTPGNMPSGTPFGSHVHQQPGAVGEPGAFPNVGPSPNPRMNPLNPGEVDPYSHSSDTYSPTNPTGN